MCQSTLDLWLQVFKIQKGNVKGLIAVRFAPEMISSLGNPTTDEVVSVNASVLRPLKKHMSRVSLS